MSVLIQPGCHHGCQGHGWKYITSILILWFGRTIKHKDDVSTMVCIIGHCSGKCRWWRAWTSLGGMPDSRAHLYYPRLAYKTSMAVNVDIDGTEYTINGNATCFVHSIIILLACCYVCSLLNTHNSLTISIHYICIAGDHWINQCKNYIWIKHANTT